MTIPTRKPLEPKHRPLAVAAGQALTNADPQPPGRTRRAFAERLQDRYRAGVAMVGRRLFYLGVIRLPHVVQARVASTIDFLLKLTVFVENRISRFAVGGREQELRHRVSGKGTSLPRIRQLRTSPAASGDRKAAQDTWIPRDVGERQADSRFPWGPYAAPLMSVLPLSRSPRLKTVVWRSDRMTLAPLVGSLLIASFPRVGRTGKGMDLGNAEGLDSVPRDSDNTWTRSTLQGGERVSEAPDYLTAGTGRQAAHVHPRIEDRSKRRVASSNDHTILAMSGPWLVRTKGLTALERLGRRSPERKLSRSHLTLWRSEPDDIKEEIFCDQMFHRSLQTLRPISVSAKRMSASARIKALAVSPEESLDIAFSRPSSKGNEESALQRGNLGTPSQSTHGLAAGTSVGMADKLTELVARNRWTVRSGLPVRAWHGRPETYLSGLPHFSRKRDIGPVARAELSIPQLQDTSSAFTHLWRRPGNDDRTVPNAYGTLSTPVMGHAYVGSGLKATEEGRRGELVKPVSSVASTVVAPTHNVKMADKPANTRVLADQVYGLIVDRIKTELRMRGR